MAQSLSVGGIVKHPAIDLAIKTATDRGEIARDVDGYHYWYPSGQSGCNAFLLRAIADHLELLGINADWDRQVRESLELLTPPDR